MGSEAFRRQPCLLLPEGLELLTRTPDLAHAQVVLETGVFGAKMEVELVNDGPVTLVVDL